MHTMKQTTTHEHYQTGQILYSINGIFLPPPIPSNMYSILQNIAGINLELSMDTIFVRISMKPRSNVYQKNFGLHFLIDENSRSQTKIFQKMRFEAFNIPLSQWQKTVKSKFC